MDADQLSIEFDILYNNISSNQAPGLSLLEKSTFLTQGKEDVVKQLYSGGAGPFEQTEEVSQYLRTLIKQVNYSVEQTSQEVVIQYDFTIQPDCWVIVYEQANVNISGCVDDNGNPITKEIVVKPITHDDFAKMMDDPFRKPDRRTVYRLLIGNTAQLYSDNSVKITGYSMRYLTNPGKVYLDDFNATGHESAPQSWTPTNFNSIKNNPLQMPEGVHRLVLLRAVQLAKAAWASK